MFLENTRKRAVAVVSFKLTTAHKVSLKLKIASAQRVKAIVSYKLTIALVVLSTILLTTFQSCKTTLTQKSNTITQTKVDSTIKGDEAILQFYQPYKKSLDSQMSSVLVYSETELTKGLPESNLSNVFSDAIASTCRAHNIDFDFALPTTNGGIRTNLPKGAITLRSAFELMPFENELVVLYLNASSVEKLAKFIVEKGGQPVSGIRIEGKKDSVISIVINNQKLDQYKTYRVLTSDYLANGGDGILAFKEAVKRDNLNIKVRDAIIEYMRYENSAGRTLKPTLDGRIKIE